MNMLLKIFKEFPIPFRYLWIGAVIGVIIDLLQNFTYHLIIRNDYEFSWFNMTSRFVSFFLMWVLLSPILYRIAENHTDIFQSGSAKSLRRWIFIGLGISLLHLTMNLLFFDLIVYFKYGRFQHWLEPTFLARTVAYFFSSILYFVLISAIFFLHIYLTKYLKKEQELNAAKLNALLMQLQPHFLFNTLHSINTLIDTDTWAAKGMVSKLGSLLRQVIPNDKDHLITFEEELNFIKNYLDIEQTRFQDRLQIIYEVEEISLNALLPRLILQPIVENTIKHGISKVTDDALIKITSRLITPESGKTPQLQIRISDNGPGFPDSVLEEKKTGIGLRNVASRLQQHYGRQYEMDISSGQGWGAVITLLIPFTTKN